jgi:signal transduction histidine kinase
VDQTVAVRRFDGLRAGAGNLLVVVITGLAMIGPTHAIDEASTRTPNGLAYALVIIAAITLWWRRTHTVAVLSLVLALQFLYHGLRFPGPGPFLALLVAVYATAVSGRRSLALVAAAAVALGSTFSQVVVENGSLLEPSVIMPVVLSISIVLLGDAVHSRRAYLAEVRERLRRAESERELETERRVTQERLRIARELHDVLAHTLTVVSVQAGVASDLFDDKPDEARTALQTIRTAGRDAMSELKATVDVLREPARSAAPRAPAPGLDQIDDLIQMAGAAGLEVSVNVTGSERSLPAAVDLTAYRVVQESLTNVLRHARATNASIRIRYAPAAVEIEVVDDGGGAGELSPTGHGITGMKERAAALGGRLETGPGPAGGFRVLVRLPTGGTAP